MALRKKYKRLDQWSKITLVEKANLFYIRDLGREALRNLCSNLLDQGLILHRLSRFHDPGLHAIIG